MRISKLYLDEDISPSGYSLYFHLAVAHCVLLAAG